MRSTAYLSDCGTYRYELERDWAAPDAHDQSVVWIMLNPSTADATADDPTIRRCISFAKTWGVERLKVVNLFAYRATDPKELATAEDPTGSLNFAVIEDAFFNAADFGDIVVCAWGASAPIDTTEAAERIKATAEHFGVDMYCLGTTKNGSPRHPLYVKGDTELELLPAAGHIAPIEQPTNGQEATT